MMWRSRGFGVESLAALVLPSCLLASSGFFSSCSGNPQASDPEEATGEQNSEEPGPANGVDADDDVAMGGGDDVVDGLAVDDDDGSNAADPDDPSGDDVAPGDGEALPDVELNCAPEEIVPEALPLRRLTTAQFRNSLSVFFPGVDMPALSLPSPVSADGFDNQASSQPNNSLLIDSEYAATAQVASRAVQQLSSWAPCEEESESCLGEIAELLATRAFRRAPSAEELTRLNEFALAELAASSFDAAAHDLIQAILLSPQTLYRVEFGSPADPAALTGEEIATRLSLLLWRQAPDDPLLDAARAGELDDSEGVSEHARRMLEDERGRATLEDFVGQWLRLDAVSQLQLNDAVYPELTEELRQSLRASIERFVKWALWEENSLDALLRSDIVFVDQRLAALLEIEGAGEEMTAMNVEHRHGILTQPGLLASTSHGSVHSPILRGLKVLRSFLCVTIAAPPPEVNAAVEPKPEGQALTTRQHVEETHSGAAACAGCHVLIDGAGFAFENYDALGRYVTEEGGLAVDPTGRVPVAGELLEVANAVELAQALETSREVRQCVSEHLYRYAQGTAPRGRGAACLIEELANTWQDYSGAPSSIIDRLVRSDAFRSLAESDKGEAE